MPVGPAEQVHALVEPLLASLDLELFDVEVAGAILRIAVERPDPSGGVDLDTIGDATTRISAALDRADPIPGRYTLEVSSPGLERTLRTPAHFRKYVDATISVKTTPDVEGERRVSGRLEAADDEGITVGG